jgi:replicative DNA helicase
VVVAPAKGGKTALLVHLGRAAALAGKKVLHVSLELDKARVLQRYDMAFGEFTKDDLKDGKRVKQARAKVEASGGNILIHDYSHRRFTAGSLDALLDRTDGEVDVVLVDYIGLMGSEKNIEGRRFEIGDSCRELRRIAADRKIPVWTASQSNRESFTAEVGPQHIAEDISVVQTCDLAIFLIRTALLDESNKMVWRTFTRNDGDNKATIYVDFNRMMFKD